jgi:hypothetical protein
VISSTNKTKLTNSINKKTLSILVFLLCVIGSVSLIILKLNKDSAPHISDKFILNPTFDTKVGTYSAGTAFPLSFEGENETLIITAFHNFGPAAGLKEQVKSEELPNFLIRTVFEAPFDKEVAIVSVKPIPVPGAAPANISVNKDLAIFIAPKDNDLPAAKLAVKKPAIGEHVWLASNLIKGAEMNKKLHEAIVTLSSEKEVDYRFVTKGIDLKATSGSPILNSKGEVVGINLGGNKAAEDLVGVGNPAASIRELIKKALNK